VAPFLRLILYLRETTMQYLILIYGDEKAFANITPEEGQKIMAAYGQYTQEMAAAGVSLGGAALAPVATATTVRVRKGKTTTTDGPFAETKEQLGGYYLIKVANLDEALKWAAKCPAAVDGGCVEVRPITITSTADGTVEMLQPPPG
jgi:hypothetical protein